MERVDLISVFLLIGFASLAASMSKRGLSGPFCKDAAALGLNDSWFYNWAPTPFGKGVRCDVARAAEFAPMFWSCYGNCTDGLPDNFRDIWRDAGVKYVLGFNEPDNGGQSNLTAAQAANFWPQIQALAQSFDPPLTLVGPGMTHWTADAVVSPWVDQFLGNCSLVKDCDPSLIKYLAFHDYSGSADSIMARANAAYKKWGRKIWLTEFSVGNGKNRAANDALMKEVVPQLDKAESVFRYAWYSTRNTPAGWVAESSLMPFTFPPWKAKGHTTCSSDTQIWLSGRSWGQETLGGCAGHAVVTPNCTTPKTITYEGGGNRNCYCSNSTCKEVPSQWISTYVEGPPEKWQKISRQACSDDQMLWLANGDQIDLPRCQMIVEFERRCSHPRTAMHENGGKHNCYCANHTCVRNASTWLDMYVEQGDTNGTSVVPTSTGNLYKSL